MGPLIDQRWRKSIVGSFFQPSPLFTWLKERQDRIDALMVAGNLTEHDAKELLDTIEALKR